MDGSDVTQASYARTGINLSNQLVQETTVITTGLSAKYGRTGGGIIIQASKSGTKDYHGRVTYRHTDPFFNPYPLGSTASNAQHENFYGFYIGGPVRIPKLYNGRDKTFFFAGGEPARIKNALSFRGAFNTPEDLQGHLHNALILLNQTTLKSNGYAAALAAPRVGGIYYNSTVNTDGFPNGGLGSDTRAAALRQATGPAGLDDVSAQLTKNPFAQFVVSNLPTPSNPGPSITFDDANATYANDGTNGVYRRGVTDVDNRWSFRIDHNFNNSNQMFVRFTESWWTPQVMGPPSPSTATSRRKRQRVLHCRRRTGPENPMNRKNVVTALLLVVVAHAQATVYCHITAETTPPANAVVNSDGSLTENGVTYPAIYKPTPQATWVRTPWISPSQHFSGSHAIGMEIDAQTPTLPSDVDKVNLRLSSGNDSFALTFGNKRYTGFALNLPGANFQVPSGSFLLAQWWHGAPYHPPVSLHITNATSTVATWEIWVFNNDTLGNPSSTPIIGRYWNDLVRRVDKLRRNADTGFQRQRANQGLAGRCAEGLLDGKSRL